jgi:hypothetical protein
LAQSIFPAATIASTPTTFGRLATIPNANNVYKVIVELGAGTYTTTCTSSTNASVYFMNGTTEIASGTTTSGTLTTNLASSVDNVIVVINTGTNVEVTFTQTKIILPSSAPSGTLYTINSSQTFSARGKAWVCLVGGGSGGNGGTPSQTTGGRGGDSGRIFSGVVSLSEDVMVTIGAGGNGGTRNNSGPNNGNSGGSTTIGNLATSANGSSASAPNGYTNENNVRRGLAGNVSSGHGLPWITNLGGPGNNGLTGSGGYSSFNYAVGAEGGEGGSGLIGAGGKGGWDGVPAANATGKGGGGGGGGTNNGAFNNTNATYTNASGGNGTQGIAYIVVI